MTERPRFLLGRALWTDHAGGSANPRNAVLLIDVEQGNPAPSRYRQPSTTRLVAPEIANSVGAEAALKTVSRQHRAGGIHGHANRYGCSKMSIPVVTAIRAARDAVVTATSTDQREKQGAAKECGRDL